MYEVKITLEEDEVGVTHTRVPKDPKYVGSVMIYKGDEAVDLTGDIKKLVEEENKRRERK